MRPALSSRQLGEKESDILAACRDLLRLRGWFVIRHQQGLGSHKGLSDLTAIRRARVLWIEVKTPRGQLSEHQERFRDEILAHGGEYAVVKSVGELEQHLRGAMSVKRTTRTVLCPLCASRVELQQKFRFWLCPSCGCEVWPKEKE